MTLLERITEYKSADFDLWVEVNNILGFSDLSECHVWPVKDTTVDEFDLTLEIICDTSYAGITREQANQLLDLGFEWVFQRIGTVGKAWSRDRDADYSLEEDTRDKRLIEKYRNEIRRLNSAAGNP